MDCTVYSTFTTVYFEYIVKGTGLMLIQNISAGFENLINNIQTFGPVLHTIKAEYDDYIRHNAERFKSF